jgi:uncharacterized protein YbaR (Trm112 family)
MPADSKSYFPIDSLVVEQLACPACMGRLRLDEGKLVCAKCRRIYPILDGIPVLIAEGAELEAIPGARQD